MAINKVVRNSIGDGEIKSSNIEDGAITSGKIDSSTTISISKTPIGALPPTITSLDTTQINPSSGATVTITGTRFVSIPSVFFMNTSTGVRVTASTVGFTSSTTLTATFPSGQTPGTYKVQVENPDGQGVLSTASIIYSIAPTWSTAANLGSVEEGESVNISLVAYDDDSTAVTSYTLVSGSLPSGVTLSGDSTIGTLTGTAPTVSADTAYTFTIRATDNENQTSDREFTLTITNWAIDNSLRFDGASSDYLSRTFGASGNTKTFTVSFWVKKCEFATNPDTMSDAQMLFGGQQSGYPAFQILFLHTNDTIFIKDAQNTNDIQLSIKTEMQFRDPAAWYHIVFAVDTTQATESDRAKLYVNGVLQTALDGENASGGATDTPLYPPQNTDLQFNGNEAHYINKYATNYEDMYMTEFHFVDGQQLTASSFGETDTASGIWIPKRVSGVTYGTNGFYLPFTNSGSLGADSSGNSNDWTVNNLTSIDQTTDTPHNNYATINPLDNYYANSTFSNGNLSITTGSTEYAPNYSTIGVSQGKWYYECKLTADSYAGSGRIGVAGKLAVNNTSYLGSQTDQVSYASGGVVTKSNASQSGTWASYVVNDIINVAVDLDNNFIYFGKNGTWQNSGDPTSGGSGTGGVSLTTASSTSLGVYLFGASDNANNGSSGFDFNFGNPPFTISSGNADANGYGNFEYAVPSGYFALNTKNLAEYG